MFSRGLFVAVAVLSNEGFNDMDDVLLLIAGEFAEFLKDPSSFADGAAATVAVFTAEEAIGAGVEDYSETRNLLWSDRGGAAFPSGIGLLSHAKFFGHLGLGQTGLLASVEQPLAETGARKFGRSTCWHVQNIGCALQNYRMGLHNYKS